MLDYRKINMLFNPEIKKEYIELISTTQKEVVAENLVNLLGRISKYEKDIDKDFCNFDYRYAKLVLILVSGRSINSKGQALSTLRKYVDWCILNGYCDTGENCLDGVKQSDLDSRYIYTLQMVKSPEHLETILNTVYNSNPNSYTIDLSNQLLFWLLYEGFTIEEAINIKKDDVDLENNIIYNSDHTKQIPLKDNLKKYTVACLNLEFVIANYNGIERELKLAQNNFLLKKVLKANNETTDFKKEYMFVIISKFNKAYQRETEQTIQLSANRVYDSGVYYRFYLKEQNGEKITDDEICKLFNISFLSGDSRIASIKRKRLDYKTWKEAFYS